MTAFLESFEKKKNDAITVNNSMEQRIIELLDKLRVLSKSNLTAAPSESGYEDLKGDLAIKEKEVKNSEMTVDAVLIGRIYLCLMIRKRK